MHTTVVGLRLTFNRMVQFNSPSGTTCICKVQIDAPPSFGMDGSAHSFARPRISRAISAHVSRPT